MLEVGFGTGANLPFYGDETGFEISALARVRLDMPVVVRPGLVGIARAR